MISKDPSPNTNPGKENGLLPTPDSYKDMLGRACRQCINVDFHADLTPRDVVYLEKDGKMVKRRCLYCLMIWNFTERLFLNLWQM